MQPTEVRAMVLSEDAKALSISEERLNLITRTVAKDHTIDELAIFLYQCRRTGLDPLSRQIYSIKRQGKATIQTGIDGYRLVAQRTKQYAGMDEILYDEGLTEYEMLRDGREHPITCTVTVYRLVDGQRMGFSATAAWDEYKPPAGQSGNGDAMWRKMPYTMLGKCSEALALRRGFPQELGGIYTNEEMEQAGPITVESRDVTGQRREASRGGNAPRQVAAPSPRPPSNGPPAERVVDEQDTRWCWFQSLAQVAPQHRVIVPKMSLPVAVVAIEAANRAMEQGILRAGGELPPPIDPDPLLVDVPPVIEGEYREAPPEDHEDPEADQPMLV